MASSLLRLAGVPKGGSGPLSPRAVIGATRVQSHQVTSRTSRPPLEEPTR